MKKSVLMSGVAAIIVGAFATPALAQDQGTAPAAGTGEQTASDEAQSGSSADDGSDAIVVTAQRREQNIQDVPLAVSALSAESLQRQEAVSTYSLLRLFPNVSGAQTSGAGANNYSIRGLSNAETAATFDSPVGTYIDGVYIARVNANNFALFDVERIEVLRGPQGTLFGRNTTNGAINILLKKPARELGASVEAELGNYDHYQVRGSVDIPLSPSVRTRFSAYKMDEDGWAKNTTTGKTNNWHRGWGARGAVSIDLGSAATWDVSADYVYDETPLISVFKNGDRFTTTSGLQKLGSLVVGKKGNIPGNFLGNYTWGITSDLKFDTTLGNFELISAYRHLKARYNLDYFNGTSAIGGFDSVEYSLHRQLSQEVKLTGSAFGDSLDYTIGAFYFHEGNDNDYTTVFRLGSGAALLGPDIILYNTADSFAGYAQFDYHLSSKLTLTAGARLTAEDKHIHFVNNGNPLAPVVTDQTLVNAGIPLRQEATVLTPRVALQYKPTEDIMMFASATRGFKSGGWNVRSNNALALRNFKPEKVWSYEAGIRSQFWDHKITTNLTAFYAETSDLQIATAVFGAAGSAPVFPVGNFSDFRSSGLEAEFNIRPVRGLSLFANAGYNKTKYVNPTADVQAQQALCLASIAANATARPNCGSGIIRLDGTIAHPLRAPEFTGTAGFSWEIPLVGDWQVVPSASIRYVSAFNVIAAELPATQDDGYTLLSGSIGIERNDGKVRFSIGCENCGNSHYLVTNISGFKWYNVPRRWFARVRYSF
jgi:iron complex outermembrane receptor protein